MERAYGFQFPEENLIEVSLDAVYGAVEAGEICNFGVVFTTSGFIRELDLRLLEDDKEFFAVYNPSLTMRREPFENYPQLREIFAPISEKLDTETLRRLNIDEDDISADYENGLLEIVVRGGAGAAWNDFHHGHVPTM
jgi:osmoprotectant transport system substrate-binding protein